MNVSAHDLQGHVRGNPGRHPFGEFLVEIERPEQTLYRVVLRQAATPQVEDVVTVVYRPETGHAP